MKSVRVPPHRYRGEVARWQRRGMLVDTTDAAATVLFRPPGTPRTFGRAVVLTVVTMGVYPLLVLLWWLLGAWWIKPIVRLTRPQRVMVISTAG